MYHTNQNLMKFYCSMKFRNWLQFSERQLKGLFYFCVIRITDYNSIYSSLLPLALTPGFQFIATPEKLNFEQRISSATSHTHIDPFFTSAALYDARFGKKMSEEIHFDLNGEERELFELFLSTFELEQFAMDHPCNCYVVASTVE